MFLLFGAFIAGMLTVLAPCVLPLLPIIIGGSVAGDNKDKKRPFVIAISLAVSLLFFTLLLKATTLLINIPPKSITYFSGTVIVILGIVTLFPSLYAIIINKLGIEQRAQKALSKGYNDKRSLIGPIVTGAALGPVFSSCSPVYAYILATVLPANFVQAIIYVVFYIAGLSLVLLAVGYYGQRFIGKIKFASNPKGIFQRVIAVLFIVVGLMIFTGYDKQFQTFISAHTPFNFDAISARLLPESSNKTDGSLLNVTKPYPAPEFTGIQQWLNGKPLEMSQLKGKVVYVDFWTYSCINCIRNNPYIQKWYDTYKGQGFTVVGVHAPEFSFEKLPANVQQAIKDQKITYPVALDNDFATWNAYGNQSWPAGYLIDATGKVRRIHAGEGQYKETEDAIRQLLVENGVDLSGKSKSTNSVVPVTANQSPETYLGKSRASNYAGSPALGADSASSGFTHAATLAKNQWSLGGSWQVDGEKITATGNSTLRFHVAAKHVYIVAGSNSPQTVQVLLDGKPISQTNAAGEDVQDSGVSIGESKLYRLVSFPQFSSNSTIELQVPDGVSLNVFTFGS